MTGVNPGTAGAPHKGPEIGRALSQHASEPGH